MPTLLFVIVYEVSINDYGNIVFLFYVLFDFEKQLNDIRFSKTQSLIYAGLPKISNGLPF